MTPRYVSISFYSLALDIHTKWYRDKSTLPWCIHLCRCRPVLDTHRCMVVHTNPHSGSRVPLSRLLSSILLLQPGVWRYRLLTSKGLNHLFPCVSVVSCETLYLSVTLHRSIFTVYLTNTLVWFHNDVRPVV